MSASPPVPLSAKRRAGTAGHELANRGFNDPATHHPIAYSNYRYAVTAECRVTKPIALGLVGEIVDTPINLQREMKFSAVEIEHEPTKRVLTAEFQAEAATISEDFPDHELSTGRSPTQLSNSQFSPPSMVKTVHAA